jgi:hypothetical protein
VRRLLVGVWIGAVAGCAATPPCPELEDIRERLKDPAQVFPVFQELVRCGNFGTAHDLLSPATKRGLVYEKFYFALTAFEASTRMILSARVHAVEAPAEAKSGRIRICGPEFGLGRDLKLAKFGGLWMLELSEEDLEYLKNRAMAWFRRQVKQADGWHFAYPPDWDYAPVGRRCICGKSA